jgi:WD40 repeat protein
MPMPRKFCRNACLGLSLGMALLSNADAQPLINTKEQATFEAYKKIHWIFDIGFSGDGKYLATFPGFAEVKVWGIKEQKCLQTFSFARPAYRSAYGAFLPSGELLLPTQREPVSNGWETWTCNVETGAKQRTRAAQTNEFAFNFWPEKNMVVALENPQNPDGPGPLRFVDLSGKKKEVVLKCDDLDRILCFSRDRSLVVLNVVRKQPHARIIEVETGKIIADFPTDTLGGCHNCLLSADNKILITASAYYPNSDWVYFWDVATGKQLRREKALSHLRSLGELSPNGRLMAILAIPNFVQFYDFKTEKFEASYRIEGADFQCLRFSPDGKTFATGDRKGTVRIFETPPVK